MWDFLDVARVLNGFLAAGVVVLAILKARLLWAWLPYPGKLMYFAFGSLLASVSYGSFDAWFQQVETGFRITFVTGALVIALGAFMYPDEDNNWMMWLVPLRDKIGIK